MKRETIDIALYNIVHVQDNYTGQISTGWLIPYKKKYAILPLDAEDYIVQYTATGIKSITYCSNGYTLK